MTLNKAEIKMVPDSFEQAQSMNDTLWNSMREVGQVLASFPKGPTGLTDPSVVNSREFKVATGNYELTKKKFELFNREFQRKFAKEIKQARREKLKQGELRFAKDKPIHEGTMMSTTLDLINAIEAGRARDIENIFNELTQVRMESAIEQRRQEIACNIFESANLHNPLPKDKYGAQYVVKGGHTLGYIKPEHPKNTMGVLAGNKDGHDWKNGDVVFSNSEIKPATAHDFNKFRVQLPSSLTKESEEGQGE